MGKDKTDKGRVIDGAFREEAVQILTTSGRTSCFAPNEIS